ncbi:hypothetical protein EDC44_10724 [Cricetibacter osteomyelitidis]|uniref:N-acetyltransferase domain-containing protein n=1 Tax=Cricetibacter osteomyelitidis TaxID=1521931 RepID=A0A4R2T1F7_9PAST|nr:GNAT family N-acetyltransferase [Cricetibacter osteomyelitidis]TCP95745.1 hypothetical protein EDC44_10724 [Cricetibacter osteomyelitidis]
MNIQHEQNNENGQKSGAFLIKNENGKVIAEMSYFFENTDTINANHTFVDPSLRGQGVADALYQQLIAFVQNNQLKLHPTCSYVVAKWKREQQ